MTSRYKRPIDLLQQIKTALEWDKRPWSPSANLPSPVFHVAELRNNVLQLANRHRSSTKITAARAHVLMATLLPHLSKYMLAIQPDFRPAVLDPVVEHGIVEKRSDYIFKHSTDGGLADLLGDIVLMGDVQLQELIYLEGIKTWRTESGFDYREVMRYMLSLRRIAAINPKLKRRSAMIVMPFPL